MKYVEEFRNPQSVKGLVKEIHQVTTRPWNIMEVCGGQTHTIVRYQLQELLPPQVNLIHGPGCPVCVTPEIAIDEAIHLSYQPSIIVASFGDILRVPGTTESLLQAKAKGARVQAVYSPLDAVQIAMKNPEMQVVFFAIGFETSTAPNALAVLQASQLGLKNFSLLVSEVRVPPALWALLGSADCQINGFLAPGHVCTVMGTQEYTPISEKYKVPIVITGFEAADILMGILSCVKQLESGRGVVENQYRRVTSDAGNLKAQEGIHRVFEVTAQEWRGLGVIPESGWKMRSEYQEFDARRKFNFNQEELIAIAQRNKSTCESGLILVGQKKPSECPHFGKTCTPERPLGAPMVSSEGACSAYYLYKQVTRA